MGYKAVSRLFPMLLLPAISYGYADPGAGAFVLQMLLAGAAGTIWGARRMLRRLLARFSGNSVGE